MSNADVTVTGNLTADPELKVTGNGRARLSFSVASQRRYQVNGEWTGETSFFNAVAWGRTAEDAGNVLEKGMPVIVKGRLEQRTWEDKETGNKRSTVEIVADTIAVNTYAIESMVRKRRDGGDDGGSGGSGQRSSGRAVPSSDPFEDF